MPSQYLLDGTARSRPGRLGLALGLSALLHVILGILIVFDVAGIGGGFGLGVGPGYGMGTGGGVGLGKEKRRQIFSLEDLPKPVPPQDPKHDDEVKDLVVARTPEAVVIPQQAKPRAVTTSPVVQFARPARPVAGGLGVGGGGGNGVGLGSLGISLDSAFGKYVGGLRKVGLDVAIVVDATGSMQNVIDDLKHRLDDLVFTMQRLVPGARIGAVAYRDRDDDNVATAPRQSENFVVKWTDLTYTSSKVKNFLDGIVAEGGGDWEEAVKEGLDTAMHQLKWRDDAKKVIILVGSSPPHDKDVPAIRNMVSDWHARGGVVSTIDVSLRLHEEHERKMHRWLYGYERKEVSPLHDFYKQLQDSFNDISRLGGGSAIALGSDQAMARSLLVQAFGAQWEKDISRV